MGARPGALGSRRGGIRSTCPAARLRARPAGPGQHARRGPRHRLRRASRRSPGRRWLHHPTREGGGPATGRTTRRPSVAPGPYAYSPGTWLWWTSAAVSAPCQPLGNDDPRAPQPHDHCHLPRASQCTTGWWLRRALRRRRVLMHRVCAGPPRRRGDRAATGRPVDRCADTVDAGVGRSADRAVAGFAAGDRAGRSAESCRGVGDRCEDGAMSGHPLARVHRRRLATQRMSSAGFAQRCRRRAPARLRAVAGRAAGRVVARRCG